MMAGWSASAVAGGFLLDHHGFGFTFIITAVLQARLTRTSTANAICRICMVPVTLRARGDSM